MRKNAYFETLMSKFGHQKQLICVLSSQIYDNLKKVYSELDPCETLSKIKKKNEFVKIILFTINQVFCRIIKLSFILLYQNLFYQSPWRRDISEWNTLVQ